MKYRAQCRLDVNGTLHYEKEKLKGFYKLLQPSLKRKNNKADLELYLVSRNKKNFKKDNGSSVNDNSLPGMAKKLKLNKDEAELLFLSKGSLKKGKFFETVSEVIKSNE